MNAQEDSLGGDARSKGGKSRAAKLTKEERKVIAQKGAAERWNLPKATHEGELAIGSVEIPCAVLEDGTRVLTQQGFLLAIGRARAAKGGQGASIDNMVPFLAANNLKPFIPSELHQTTTPIKFRTINGTPAFGFKAELLPEVCDVFLAARRAGKLLPSQGHIAEQCELLLSGFARVGIRALIDEATGYQYDRPRKDLEEYLESFLSERLRRWVRTFPTDYFKHLCRLRGVELRPDMRLPQYFGHLTRNIVYRRIAPGLLKRIQERKVERGSKSNKLHSWLNEDKGVPEVLFHLGRVVSIMESHTNYEDFEKHLNKSLPMFEETPGLFDNPEDWEPKTK